MDINLLIRLLGYPFNDSTIYYFNVRISLLTAEQISIITDLQTKIVTLETRKQDFLINHSMISSEDSKTYYYSSQIITRFYAEILTLKQELSSLLNIPLFYQTNNSYLTS